MKLFMNDKQLKEENETLKAQLETMEASSEASMTELVAAQEAIADKTQEFTEATALSTELTAQVETLTSEKAALEVDLAAEKEATVAASNSAEEKAKVMLASMGHNPVELMTDEAKTKQEAVSAEYKAMAPGPERDQFRKAHPDQFPIR